MTKKIDYYEKLNRNSSACQGIRLSPIIHPGYIPVDERDISQLLVAIRAYADNLHYYNRDNKRQGSWLRLFDHNAILLLSNAATVNIEALRENYLTTRRFGLKSHIKNVMELIIWFDQWCTSAEMITHEVMRSVLVKIKKILQHKVRDQLLCTLSLNQHYDNVVDTNIDNLCSSWGVNRETLDQFISHNSLKITRSEKELRLQKSFDTFLSARVFLAREALSGFQQLLKSQCHDPAASMLLAFLQTYKKSQHLVNQFPSKLLSFYYDTILKNKLEPGLRDNVILKCQKILGDKPLVIPEGYIFHGGKTEDLKDILYATKGTTILTGASLAALKTIYLQRHINISPENMTASVTAINSADLGAVIRWHDSEKKQKGDTKKFGLFGTEDAFSQESDVDNNSLEGPLQDDDIGLYIPSSVLYLKEGTRRVSLDIELTDILLDRMVSLRDKPAKKADIRLSDQFDVLDKDKYHLISSLYQCLSSDLKKNSEILFLLNNFCKNLDSNRLNDWKRGDRFSLSQLIKDLWIYLYCSVEDYTILGIFHRYLLSRKLFNPNYLSCEDHKTLLNKIDSLPEASCQQKIYKLGMKKDMENSSFALLMHYFSDAFDFKLTQEEGWLLKKNYSINHLSNDFSSEQALEENDPKKLNKFSSNNRVLLNKRALIRSGFKLQFKLDSDIGPIVAANPAIHGAENTIALPILIMRINPLTKIFPYSFLEPFLMKTAKLSVRVGGLRDVSIHNEYGQVDNSKPFMPFSAIPRQDSRFYLGGYEYAKKNVTELGVSFTWKNLPANYGGFANHYSAYGHGMANSDYQVNVTMLVNGDLQPKDEELQQTRDLFSYSTNTNTLYEKSHIDYQYIQANPKIDESVRKQDYDRLTEVEHAYLCFRLRSSKKVFGHTIYPILLGDTLVKNSRRRKQIPLPEQPYTPEIARVDVNYTAQETVEFARDYQQLHVSEDPLESSSTVRSISKKQLHASAYYKTPLGLELAHSHPALSESPLLPQWREDGNLYLGFVCPERSETLCIYFQLNKDATHLASLSLPDLQWHYYSPRGWQALDKRYLLADSTDGLIHSGIITIQLPKDRYAHPGLQPRGKYWLRISTSVQLHDYATLKGLSFDAILLESVDANNKLSKHNQGMSTQWRAYEDIAEIQSLQQTQAAFSNTDVESRDESQVRLYERLRHKNRALCLWDYERLVLEKFPEVDLVKCLPACRFNQCQPAPGHILVVVMPRLIENENIHNQGHHLNSVTLANIADTLRDCAPAIVKLDVINASYEYIQVRCAVRFKDRVYQGERMKQLQSDISTYISPWSVQGPATTFAWSITNKGVEAFISSLDYVSAIAKVSLVKCYSDNEYPDYFRLEDTADLATSSVAQPVTNLTASSITNSITNPISKSVKNNRSPALSSISAQSIKAAYPWSLPLPSKHHYIEIMKKDNTDQLTAEPVGINSLEIGNTFVLRKANNQLLSEKIMTEQSVDMPIRDSKPYVEA